MALPPTIGSKAARNSNDPAKYLVFPGTVNAPGRHTPGNLRHARPYFVNGSKMYVFPIGVEGFRRSGQAQLGLRHYIGDWAVDGVTVHYEEARIVLSGTFPGLTAQQHMVDCLQMLRSKHSGRGITLYAPGVFEREQFVLPESWEFDHAEDDRTSSITYNISLVKLGEGPKVKDDPGTPPSPSPRYSRTPKGKPARTFTVNGKYRTLRAIAAKVYGDSAKWPQIVNLNATFFSRQGIPTHDLSTIRLPLGVKFRY